MKKYRMSGDEAQKTKLLDTEKDFNKIKMIFELTDSREKKKEPGREGHT